MRLRKYYSSGSENDPRSGFHNIWQAISWPLQVTYHHIIHLWLGSITALDDPIVHGRLRRSRRL